jgi:hypothetical protein
MKSSNNIYVGLDFSLVSPAICLIQDQEFKWISLYKTTEDESTKLLKKTDGPFSVLDSTDAVKIAFTTKKEKQAENYSGLERVKLLSSIAEVDGLLATIKQALLGRQGKVYFAMEGVSFGSKGNTLIDICMATGMFRKGMTEILESTEDLYVFSPGTIKKFAIKGGAQKSELYDALLERGDLAHLDLPKLMRTHKASWVTKSGTVKKPLDDLVDATWISLLLREVIEGRFEEVKTKPSKKSKKAKIPLES